MDQNTDCIEADVTALSWVGGNWLPVPLWADEVVEAPSLVHTLTARISVRGGEIVAAEYVSNADEVDGPVPVRRSEPVVGPAQAFFAQTVGSRGATPGTPLVWTSLELVVRADGACYGVLVESSRDSHHAIYDQTGALSGLGGSPDGPLPAPWLLRAG